jgi:outer membrane protein OmpA-like peptidoglycan-associated protein/tetratricopeptide (TPR) repeat protein
MIDKSKFHYFLFSLLVLAASCSYTEKIRDGRSAFERKQFAVAIPMLEKEFLKSKEKKEKAQLAFQIAESYTKTGKNETAIAWYKKAIDQQYGAEAFRAYANALKKDEQYGEAAKAFKEASIEIGSPFEFKKDIESCQVAGKWKTIRSPYLVDKQAFNSMQDDYAAAIYAADQIVITSDRGNNGKEEKYQWTGKSFSDLYTIDKKNNIVKPFSTQINTADNEGAATFNGTFTKMIFVRNAAENEQDDQFTKLYYSERAGVVWSKPEMLPFCASKTNYWHPCLSADGNSLIFSANGGEGIGGFDLYSTTKSDEKWAVPKLLPRNINSIGNEVFPTIDGDTLYFSSDFWQGMGGLDVFKTVKMGNGIWSQPQNLRAPINSGADDFSFVVDEKKQNGALQNGFFSSNRKGGQGGDDIYAFRKIILPPLPVDTIKKTTTDNPKSITYKLLLEGYVLEKIYAQSDNPNSKVVARKGVPNSIVAINIGKETKKIVSNEEGFFSLEALENTDYQFVASKENYLNNSTSFSTKGIAKDANNPTQKFEVEIVLDKIYKNKEITLENIYYDYDKWDIRTDAQPTLNQLAQTLVENPNIKIQLNSHTDCRGNDQYNEELSQRRAQAAVDYLISKGIASNRLTAKGYGETIPAVLCQCNKCSEDEHQANRRTTFKIVE